MAVVLPPEAIALTDKMNMKMTLKLINCTVAKVLGIIAMLLTTPSDDKNTVLAMKNLSLNYTNIKTFYL